MSATGMQLTGFDPDEFLRDYWQKKPLLIRNAFAQWSNPLEPDELAGLSLEAHVESRLIFGESHALVMENGPLAADRFDALGRDPWTLLVQAVDHHVPAVADLLAPFRFIPNWRVDDVMVSFATTGGGVGPHFDNYDVFLVQGLGTRRWQLGQWCDDDTALRPHDGLKLLAEFNSEQNWLLEPGDILYVPPGLAHDGTAQSDDCMTYSIGFRAPSRGELIDGFASRLADGQREDDRFGDPDLQRQINPGEIAPAALDRLHAMLTEQLQDRTAFARWFAEYATERKHAHIDWRPEHALSMDRIAELLQSGCDVIRNPASRFAFVMESPGTILLAVDGRTVSVASALHDFVQDLCASDHVMISASNDVSPELCALIETLHNDGAIGVGQHGDFG
ncbi:cupin domain-containing protein [Erythrobacter sp. Alg231-14]|uniref:cupin domain-containing protein n=1 Tax=Erythrobacter sp. Alg231-14 TaxID=1922225 RepID=UPI00307C0804